MEFYSCQRKNLKVNRRIVFKDSLCGYGYDEVITETITSMIRARCDPALLDEGEDTDHP